MGKRSRRANGRRYGPEVKAKVMGELAAGRSPPDAAKAHGISLSTAQKWKKELPESVVVTQESVIKAELSRLVPKFAEEAFKSLIFMTRLAQDEEWLKRYSPSEVAILGGVIADKLFRVLDSASRQIGGLEEPEGEAGDTGQP